jgi:hypothetical protein
MAQQQSLPQQRVNPRTVAAGARVTEPTEPVVVQPAPCNQVAQMQLPNPLEGVEMEMLTQVMRTLDIALLVLKESPKPGDATIDREIFDKAQLLALRVTELCSMVDCAQPPNQESDE